MSVKSNILQNKFAFTLQNNGYLKDHIYTYEYFVNI